jgi:hypothetical protein
MRSALNMIEDSEVDWHVFTVKKKVLKSKTKNKTWINFEVFCTGYKIFVPGTKIIFCTECLLTPSTSDISDILEILVE